jgi:putative ABC transport system permease protein
MAMNDVRSLSSFIDASIVQERLLTALMSFFGLLAMLLAAIGLYGIMAYSVSQRTHEIGIRVALGAQSRDVLRLVIGQGMKLVLLGVSAGLAAAFGLTRLLKALLFGVSATDPMTFAVVALLLTLVALLACWIPARRATRVDPLVAIKYE